MLKAATLTHLICSGLTDATLATIATCCKRLTHMSIAGCMMVNYAGSVAGLPLVSFDASKTMIDLRTLLALHHADALARLILIDCRLLDADAITAILPKKGLKYLAATISCTVTPSLTAASTAALDRGVCVVIEAAGTTIEPSPSVYCTSQHSFYEEHDLISI